MVAYQWKRPWRHGTKQSKIVQKPKPIRKPVKIEKKISEIKPTIIRPPQQTQKKKLNLTDISKGFLKYAREQGSNLVRYTHSNSGIPTEEQLKHERYVSKLLNCIQTTFSIKRRNFRFIQKVSLNDWLVVDIDFVLYKNGTLTAIRIMKQSIMIEFDQFMLNVIKDSSSSFPPVPKYFNTDHYRVPIRFSMPVRMIIG